MPGGSHQGSFRLNKDFASLDFTALGREVVECLRIPIRRAPIFSGPFLSAGLSASAIPSPLRCPTGPATLLRNFRPGMIWKKTSYFLRRVTLGEHSGTHLTAPASYYRDGRTVDQYAAGDLVCPAVVVDAREQCSRNPDYALSAGDVLAWEKLHGRTPAGLPGPHAHRMVGTLGRSCSLPGRGFEWWSALPGLRIRGRSPAGERARCGWPGHGHSGHRTGNGQPLVRQSAGPRNSQG